MPPRILAQTAGASTSPAPSRTSHSTPTPRRTPRSGIGLRKPEMQVLNRFDARRAPAGAGSSRSCARRSAPSERDKQQLGPAGAPARRRQERPQECPSYTPHTTVYGLRVCYSRTRRPKGLEPKHIFFDYMYRYRSRDGYAPPRQLQPGSSRARRAAHFVGFVWRGTSWGGHYLSLPLARPRLDALQ